MNDVTVKQTFEERMSERIKEQIGDMIEPEDLKKLITQGIQKAFFEPQVTSRDSYGRVESREAPILTLIRDEMKLRVALAVGEYLNEHSAELEVTIKEVVQQGIGVALLSAVNAKFQSDLFNLQQNFINTLSRG